MEFSNKIISRSIAVFFIALIAILPIKANYFYEYSPLAVNAYDQIIQLKFIDASKSIQQLKLEEPANLVVLHLENYIDFFKIFIGENEEEFKILEKRKQDRLQVLKKGPADSPYHLFIQAEVQLQWALARLKFEEYLNAFSEVSKAYKQLKENELRFPGFIGNKKSLGIIHALVGTIPENYRWGIKLLGGMEGTIAQGKAEIEEVLAHAEIHDFLFEQETIFMYAFLMLHLDNNKEAAWQIVNNQKLNVSESPLACFAKANVALRTGRSDTAIEILESRPKGEEYHPFHYLDLILGFAKLYRQDKDAAHYIKSYVEQYNGVNYIKEAYQKLAWHALINQKSEDYDKYMLLCASQGGSILDADKSALKEAKSKEKPHVDLLKARLLFDGGYYSRAYQHLISIEQQFDFFKNQLEYKYRLGRILHLMERYDEALLYYEATISMGKTSSYFYGCNAALQCGLIHEQDHEFEKAKSFLNLCLSMRPDNYKNSLHQKAEAALERIKSLNNSN